MAFDKCNNNNNNVQSIHFVYDKRKKIMIKKYQRSHCGKKERDCVLVIYIVIVMMKNYTLITYM